MFGRPLSQIFVELTCAFGFKTAFVLKRLIFNLNATA